LPLAKGRVKELTRLAKVRRVGVHPATGDQIELREGFGRQPASQGVGPGERFDETRLRGPAAGALSGETGVKGREARGAAERGHEQDAPSFNARQGARRGWRLAHGSALEALGELGRCSTVMRRVL